MPDEHVKHSCTPDAKKQFAIFNKLDNVKNANYIYNKILSLHYEAAEVNIPKSDMKIRRLPRENISTTRERKAPERQKIKGKRTKKLAFSNLKKKKLNEAYNAKLQNYTKEKVCVMQNVSGNQYSTLAWATFSERVDRGIMNEKNPEEQVEKQKEHFVDLLGKPPSTKYKPICNVYYSTLPIETDEFMKD